MTCQAMCGSQHLTVRLLQGQITAKGCLWRIAVVDFMQVGNRMHPTVACGGMQEMDFHNQGDAQNRIFP
jgi:hypothetical protein